MYHQNHKILIIDDDPSFHQQVRYAFRHNFEFEGAINEHRLKQKLETGERFDLVLLDLFLLKDSEEKVGLRLISVIKNYLPDAPIIIVTNDDNIQTVVDATKKGADNFLYKGDYDKKLWEDTFNKSIDSRATKQENKKLKKELTQIKREYEYQNPKTSPLLGVSSSMERIRKTLKILAGDPEMTVLITGETGVGKGVAARFLHYNSLQRSTKPFEEIHISNITKTLLESTLFGAKKGTFTGAKEDIKGRLHLANEGIVFLDEIGDLDMDNQVKLLQFVQTKTIRPIGSRKDIELDVQIVAATNKNLREQVAKGKFREDLYQRLKVFPIEIPPLRERREDIMELFLYFAQFDSESALYDAYEEEVLDFLIHQYQWIGNVRELENTIKGIQIRQQLLDAPRVNMSCLPEDMLIGQTNTATPTINSRFQTSITTTNTSAVTSVNVEEQRAITALRAIEKALIEKNGVKKDVAEALNFKSADSLRYRVKTTFENFPHLLKAYPTVCEKYKLSVPS